MLEIGRRSRTQRGQQLGDVGGDASRFIARQ